MFEVGLFEFGFVAGFILGFTICLIAIGGMNE
jgi:hypothetical protein